MQPRIQISLAGVPREERPNERNLFREMEIELTLDQRAHLNIHHLILHCLRELRLLLARLPLLTKAQQDHRSFLFLPMWCKPRRQLKTLACLSKNLWIIIWNSANVRRLLPSAKQRHHDKDRWPKDREREREKAREWSIYCSWNRVHGFISFKWP